MAAFELRVDEAAFEKVGTRAHFDQEHYAGLLDAAGVPDNRLAVNIAPHFSWGKSFVRRVLDTWASNFAIEPMGVYTSHWPDGNIIIYESL